MANDQVELKEYLQQLAEQIETGLEVPSKRSVPGGVKVDVNIERVAKDGDGVKFYVVEGDSPATRKTTRATFTFTTRHDQDRLGDVSKDTGPGFGI